MSNGFSQKEKFMRSDFLGIFTQHDTINRFVHARTSEGDSEKLSRHENAEPLLIFSLMSILSKDVVMICPMGVNVQWICLMRSDFLDFSECWTLWLFDVVYDLHGFFIQ